MSQLRALLSDAELCAYLDGELAPDRRAEVENWLASQPEARARIEAWRRQSQLLRASFGRIAQEPLPATFTFSPKPPARIAPSPRLAPAFAGEPALQEPGPRASPRSGLWRMGAMALLGAAAALGVAVSGVLSNMRDGADPEPLVSAALFQAGQPLQQRASEAHAAFAGAGDRLWDARGSDPAALAAFAAQAGLDAPLPAAVPGLQALGLRLTPGDRGLAGLVVYNSEKDGRVSLYVSRAAAATSSPGVLLRERGGLTVASFTVNGIVYALTASAGRDRMVDWASALRGSLVQPRSLRGS